MLSDVRGVANDMARPLGQDAGPDRHPPLVIGLDPQQALDRIFIDQFDVDRLVMDVAEQHEIARIVREEMAEFRIPARTVRRIGDDVGVARRSG
ncbi:hypothetical protein NZL82_17920 [Sphingomonas sanguinis]|uniref:hypothetical protein n=1 Tax=Sphingomonas sp. LC-1 TaxID=3110957 RepID=UPI0021BA5369|nr:hypothetical protein [Sphingomonas sp. LC-1]MCT8003753.1 hypothetical protein [Sphingomonas sp. LC-1]